MTVPKQSLLGSKIFFGGICEILFALGPRRKDKSKVKPDAMMGKIQLGHEVHWILFGIMGRPIRGPE